MQRNTLLFTAFLAVLAALVVGVNIGRNLSQPAAIQSPTGTPAPTPIAILRYESPKCGIMVKYPSNLQVKESTTSATAFIDIKDINQSVLLICQPNIPRIPLTPDKIESIVLHPESGTSTVSAKLYHDSDEKDGSPVDRLIFTNAKKGIDVFIGGYGKTFNDIIASIKLL